MAPIEQSRLIPSVASPATPKDGGSDRVSSRAAPTRSLYPGRLDEASRFAIRAISPDVALALAVSTVLSIALALFGPPGVDRAAHQHLTAAFATDGWRFWDNYWYAGRYELVNYSPLYYPLAALIGYLTVAVIAVVAGAGLFASAVLRQWGPPARLSALLFAAFWPGVLIAGQYPFALGCAFALAALVSMQRGHPVLLVLSCLTSLLASPLAFLLLGVTLVGLVAAQRRALVLRQSRVLAPVCAITLLGLGQLLVFRAFPAGGAFAYPLLDLAGITGFALCGALLARGDARARPLVGVFLAYLALGWAAKLYPSALGGNATRLLDYIALPLLALVAALRGFRPRLLVALALSVAVAWQSVPLIKNAVGGYTDQAQAATFWLPALDFLRPIAQRAPNFRVEVVATWGHSEAYFLPKSGIPLAGGWYRQNSYRPQDLPDYRGGPVTPALYRDWLRAMGVRYVLLPHDELDPAARAEAKLLEQGVPGISLVRSSSPNLAIYELADASPILTPPPGAPADAAARTRILRMTGDSISLYAPVPGVYSLRVTYTHDWRTDDPTAACVERGPGPMSQLVVVKPGPVRLHVSVSFEGAVTGVRAPVCDSPPALPPS
jgi:hypothetical protein